MASGRCVPPGGSYGRAQAVIAWALDNWREFDAWCCIQHLEPYELPFYRFYNLVIHYIKEQLVKHKSAEERAWEADILAELETTLSKCDEEVYPLQDLNYIKILRGIAKVSGSEIKETDNKPDSKHKYIPPWWRGEETNANVALQAMQGVQALPPMSK